MTTTPTPEPSAGAMRAAMEINRTFSANETGFPDAMTVMSADEIAAIIDRETGLRELCDVVEKLLSRVVKARDGLTGETVLGVSFQPVSTEEAQDLSDALSRARGEEAGR